MLRRLKLPTIFQSQAKWLERSQTTILSAALIITFANILSSVAGLVRERLLISYFFDTLESRQALEAFQIAFQLPDTLFQLMVLGAVTASFIPIFSQLRKKSEQEAYAMSNVVMSWILLGFIIASSLLFLFSYPLNAWRTGHQFTAQQLQIASQLTRLFLVAQLFFAFSNFLSGMLQAQRRFVIPALAPIIYNLGIILGVIFLTASFGIYAAGIGVLIGAICHMLIQLPFAYRLGFRFRPSLNWRLPGVMKLFKLMPPRIATYAVNEVQTLSLAFFATTMGNLSFLMIRLAMRLMILPIRLFGVPIGQASLAFLAAETSEADLARFRSLLIQSLNQVSFVTLPAAILLLILRVPVVRLVFGSSNLPWENTVATGKVLAILALSISAQALVQILVRAFHALNDTKTPFYVTIITIIVYLLGCSFFVFLTPYGFLGIAFMITLTAFLEFGTSLILLHGKIGSLLGREFYRPQLKMLTATFLMAIFLYLPFRVLDELIFETSRTIELLALTLVTSTIGMLAYLFFASLLEIHELRIFSQAFDSIAKWRGGLTKTPEMIAETNVDDGLP